MIERGSVGLDEGLDAGFLQDLDAETGTLLTVEYGHHATESIGELVTNFIGNIGLWLTVGGQLFIEEVMVATVQPLVDGGAQSKKGWALCCWLSLDPAGEPLDTGADWGRRSPTGIPYFSSKYLGSTS